MYKRIKLNNSDISVITFLIILIISFLLIFNFVLYKNSSNYVNIYLSNKIILSSNLIDDKIIVLTKEKYPILLGDMEIEIKDKKVRVIEETSERNICSSQGWISKPNIPIICLPNSIYIIIIGGSTMDAVIK